MRRFTRLCLELAATTSSSRKVDCMVAYFRAAPPRDAAWALAYLLGARGRRPVSSTLLRTWACEAAGIPQWLFDASYDGVGDLGETLALVLPDPPAAGNAETPGLAEFVATYVTALAGAEPERARQVVERAWATLDVDGRFVYHKLIGGAFRMGVARGLVFRAMAEVTGLPLAVITHRLTGSFEPTEARWSALASPADDEADAVRPYPFCLATQLAVAAGSTIDAELGPVGDWQIERKYDGIRCQLLRRGDALAVVSRGEERIDGSFPELVALARRLPSGTVLDGEVLLVERDARTGGDRILPFSKLQPRLNAKRAAWQAEPGLFDLERVSFLAYDLLEEDGRDRRADPLAERRAALERMVSRVGDDRLRLSPALSVASWSEAAEERARSRALGVEGLMLKRRDAAYGIGRERKAGWWKWKVDPYSIDVVLVAAQPGSGRRANLLTDYTFAVWRGAELVTVAKAYSGLTDEEIALVDRHARATTTARKGPVRLVEPQLVFELGFEGLERSTRHKAGIALRFPRILRWRHDKRPSDADRVDALERLLAAAANVTSGPLPTDGRRDDRSPRPSSD
ncbi:MAG: ATP-dependent DNA ligase [Phycisphaerae bacterium]|nr:ATP-dependent DNA ligase [Phycisphaerae bacterium]